jgi:DNA-binding transcriptional LysR family regulator
MLTLSQSAVSRQVSALEEEIATPLFQRHARGLTLTDEGELLYSAVSDVLARLGQAEEALKNVQAAPRGSLKVTTSHGLGMFWLLPKLEAFLRDFPELQLHFVFEDRELDLAQREADIALRMRAPVQADLIQRKLFTVHYHIYAAPSYLARAGKPDSFEDLAAHQLIVYGETAAPEIREVNWLANQVIRLEPGTRGRALRINNIGGILQAAEAGLGVAALPDYIAAERRTLVKLLPEIEGPTFDVHLVYCDALRQSKRVGAFRDFLVREAKEWRY